ncbi:MAG: hypothetical protein A3E84_05030 [Gammaproteobacteria bacterium RIFCSPHIGHO2_12_FULL_42_13]|nr:MAG: hypothetical protein A3E84_05030 [Gammaproteobacteria bacterium RIFCSPHIGHO2_12_FULL_42_13]
MNRIERECAKKIKENSLIPAAPTEAAPASSPPVSARQTRPQLAGGGFRVVGNGNPDWRTIGTQRTDQVSQNAGPRH